MIKQKKELKEHGLTMFPIACYDDNLEFMSVPWHWHDEFEFIIITEGLKTHIQIENKTIPLSKGNAIFINSGVLHNIDNGSASN